MVLKIFICPSHIANWSLGLLESMGRDRHPIRALGNFHYQLIFAWEINQCHSILKWASRKTKFWHNSCIRSYGNYLPDDRRDIKRWSIYWGMKSSIGNSWAPLLDYCKTNAFNLASHQQSKHWAWIETKEMGMKLKIHVKACHEQLICAQEVDSKVGEMIYLWWGSVFILNFNQISIKDTRDDSK